MKLNSYWKLCLAIISIVLSHSLYAKEQWNALVIHSYHTNFPSYKPIETGLNNALKGQNIELDVYYMDSKRFSEKTNIDNFKASLSHKIKVSKASYDVILSTDDNALNFVINNREELFKDIPIVFMGVNDQKKSTILSQDADIKGVMEHAPLEENVNLIQSIHPKINKLTVIVDSTTSGQADLVELKSKIKYPIELLQILDLSYLTWEEASEKISVLNTDRDPILLLSAYKDSNGDLLNFEESLTFIANNTEAPIYHPYKHGIGQGAIGGIILSHEIQGFIAGELILKTLKIGNVKLPNIINNAPTTAYFDFLQLQKHNIATQYLPLNSIYINKPQPIYKKYQDTIAIALILTVTVLFVLLSYVLIRKNILNKEQLKLKSILDTVDDYIYLKDRNGTYTYANKKMREQFNQDIDAVSGKKDIDFFPPEIANKVNTIDKSVMATGIQYCEIETYWRRDSGQQQTVNTRKVPLFDKSGNVYALCGASTDITKLKQQEKIIEQIAYLDPTHGLVNRVDLYTQLSDAMSRAVNTSSTLLLAVIDIDNFKHVNLKFGHTYGDDFLEFFFNKIIELTKGEGTVIRLGGDEFYIILERLSDDVYNDFSYFKDQLPLNFTHRGSQCELTICAGISTFPDETYAKPEQLIRQSEFALYEAKKQGRNQVYFLHDGDRIELNEHNIKNEILRGLNDDQFIFYFQPKVCTRDNSLVGCEALIRWNHPIKGLLGPGQFLPEIYKLGLSDTLDNWVIDKALDTIQHWRSIGYHFPLSINISHSFIAKELALILKEKAIQGNEKNLLLLEVEILETHAVDNIETAAKSIKECKKLGVSFSIDDFGTGYSTLTYLQQLPINTLKVDQRFVRHTIRDAERGILKGILVFCEALNLQPVVEGVETLEQLKTLQALGYDTFQGYFISKPLNEVDYLEWVSRQGFVA
ncbi:ABC transporter substrate binding protein [Vibrio cyclitrophicus]